MKKQVITFAGLLGSGKSSTAKRVAEILGYSRFSAGDFQRAAAESMGVPYAEYQKVAEGDPQYDRRADEALTEAGTHDKRVIDARLGYHFIPHSFKVFLTLPPEVAAERILKDAQVNPDRHKESAEGAKDIATIIKSITERKESERVRYKKYYNLDNVFDHQNFDLVIDTSKHPLEEVVQMVVAAYQQWLAA